MWRWLPTLTASNNESIDWWTAIDSLEQVTCQTPEPAQLTCVTSPDRISTSAPTGQFKRKSLCFVSVSCISSFIRAKLRSFLTLFTKLYRHIERRWQGQRSPLISLGSRCQNETGSQRVRFVLLYDWAIAEAQLLLPAVSHHHVAPRNYFFHLFSVCIYIWNAQRHWWTQLCYYFQAVNVAYWQLFQHSVLSCWTAGGSNPLEPSGVLQVVSTHLLQAVSWCRVYSRGIYLLIQSFSKIWQATVKIRNKMSAMTVNCKWCSRKWSSGFSKQTI